MPRELLPCTFAKFRTGELRSVGIVFLGAATVSMGYFTPAVVKIAKGSTRSRRPRSGRCLLAKGYARQHGIRWRIVEGK
jgi:hypothetical protein